MIFASTAVFRWCYIRIFNIAYTYGNRSKPTNVLNNTTALALQDQVTSFVVDSAPSGAMIPRIPPDGNDSELLDLNLTSITVFMDPNANVNLQKCLT